MRNELLDGFRLRDKRIEPLSGTVRGKDGYSHLPSKSIEVLMYLARQPRQLVSREEILEKVWGDTTASQESLSHAISEIRQALGDRTDRPEYIQTVPKRGYRLLVEPVLNADDAESNVEVSGRATLVGNLMDRGVIQASVAFALVGWVMIQVADAVVPIVGLPAWTIPFVTFTVIGGFPVVVIFAWFFEYAEGRFYLDRGKVSPTVTTGIGKNYLTMVAAYAITAAGALIYQFSAGFEVPEVTADSTIVVMESSIDVAPNSIAVLRFMNIDGSETSDVFSYGLAEDVLDRLARIPDLLVASRGDSWSLPVNSPSEVVRNRLRVAYYLEGSVRFVDGKLRVVAQLIDSASGFHIVSKSFDRDLENIMGVQTEITELTVANLRVALPEDTQMLLATNYPGPDVDVYVLYRRGKELFDKPHTEKSLAEVADLYNQALAMDPEYAAAHAGLCVAYAKIYEFNNDTNFVGLAEKACAEALVASPNLHMVYTALGDLYLLSGRDDDGETAYMRALAINNKDVQAMQGLALAYERQQRGREAEELLNQAIHLQPGNWRSINSLGGFLFASGRYAEAAGLYRQVVLLDPNNWHGHGNLGSSLLMAGEFEPAANALRRSLEIEYDAAYSSNLGVIYYYLGRFDDAVAIHRQVVDLYPDSSVDWLNLGDALTFSSEASLAEGAYRISADLAEKMLAVNPNDASTIYRLAWATMKLGNAEYANELIARSMSIAPSNPYVNYYSGLIKLMEKDDEAATRELGIAVRSGYPAKMIFAEPFLAKLNESEDFVRLINAAERQVSGR